MCVESREYPITSTRVAFKEITFRMHIKLPVLEMQYVYVWNHLYVIQFIKTCISFCDLANIIEIKKNKTYPAATSQILSPYIFTGYSKSNSKASIGHIFCDGGI